SRRRAVRHRPGLLRLARAGGGEPQVVSGDERRGTFQDPGHGRARPRRRQARSHRRAGAVLVSPADTGTVVWLTGLPSSGKSTLARRALELLRERGRAACVLDSDDVRGALVPPPGYGDAERDAFYDTLARLAALLAGQGLVVLVPATANRRLFRERARQRAPRYLEVFVDVPLEECARRDAKGLYRASRAGEVSTLPGAGAGYEPPRAPDVVAQGGKDEDAARRIAYLLA